MTLTCLILIMNPMQETSRLKGKKETMTTAIKVFPTTIKIAGKRRLGQSLLGVKSFSWSLPLTWKDICLHQKEQDSLRHFIWRRLKSRSGFKIEGTNGKDKWQLNLRQQTWLMLPLKESGHFLCFIIQSHIIIMDITCTQCIIQWTSQLILQWLMQCCRQTPQWHP